MDVDDLRDDNDSGEDTDLDAFSPASPTSEDGFGNEEDEGLTADAQSWEIDHSRGHHRLKGIILRRYKKKKENQ